MEPEWLDAVGTGSTAEDQVRVSYSALLEWRGGLSEQGTIAYVLPRISI